MSESKTAQLEDGSTLTMTVRYPKEKECCKNCGCLWEDRTEPCNFCGNLNNKS